MSNVNLPMTPLELERCLKDIIAKLNKSYIFTTDLLMNIYSNYSRGNDLTNIISPNELNNIFDAINNGYDIIATGNNKCIKVIYADTEEVTSDDYKAVTIVFVNGAELVKFTFTKFGTSVFLDAKTITTI